MENNLYYKQFFDKYINKSCKLLIVKNKETLQEYKSVMKAFLSLKRIKTCGFDLEFNNEHGTRQIALIQLALYFDNEIIIIFIDSKPSTLPEFKQLLVDQTVSKIGHGTDSLDIPALYKLLNDNDKILLFTKSLYDTRFLCEYLNSLTDNRLCNIYHSIEKFQVIDKEQVDFLAKNEKKLGKFWLTIININTLSKPLIEYAMYDALYLKKLTVNLKAIIKDKQLSYNLITDTTRLILLLRQNILTISSISSYHSYMHQKQTLKALFDIAYEKFIEKTSISNKKIFNFGFFRKQLLPFLQIVFYNSMFKYDIYASNNVKANNEKLLIALDDIKDIVLEFPLLNKIINEFLLLK